MTYKLFFILIGLVLGIGFVVSGADLRILTVPQGGTGLSSTSPNAIITAGISPTGAWQATSSLPLYVGSLTATSSTASSTFRGGVIAETGLRLNTYTTCTALETDSSGFIQCGTDDTSTVPNLIQLTVSGTKYYTASTTVSTNLSWYFPNGFTSNASSSIYQLTVPTYLGASTTAIFATTTVLGSFNTGTLTATSGTSYINALSLGTVLSVANGGSGAATFTTSGVLFGSGTSAFGVSNAGASSTVLTTDGTTPRFNNGISLQQLTVTSTSTIQSLWVGLGGATTTSLYISGSSTVSSTFNVGGASILGSSLFVVGSSTHSGSLIVQGQATTTDTWITGTFANSISSTTGTLYHNIVWGNGTSSVIRIILEGNTTIDMNATSSKPTGGMVFKFEICQSSTPSRTLSWANPIPLRWWNGTTTISSAAFSCTWIGGIYDDYWKKYMIIASSTGVLNQ